MAALAEDVCWLQLLRVQEIRQVATPLGRFALTCLQSRLGWLRKSQRTVGFRKEYYKCYLLEGRAEQYAYDGATACCFLLMSTILCNVVVLVVFALCKCSETYITAVSTKKKSMIMVYTARTKISYLHELIDLISAGHGRAGAEEELARRSEGWWPSTMHEKNNILEQNCAAWAIKLDAPRRKMPKTARWLWTWW